MSGNSYLKKKWLLSKIGYECRENGMFKHRGNMGDERAEKKKNCLYLSTPFDHLSFCSFWPLILLIHPCQDDWCLISLLYLCQNDQCLISLMHSCRDNRCLISLINPCRDDCLIHTLVRRWLMSEMPLPRWWISYLLDILVPGWSGGVRASCIEVCQRWFLT